MILGTAMEGIGGTNLLDTVARHVLPIAVRIAATGTVMTTENAAVIVPRTAHVAVRQMVGTTTKGRIVPDPVDHITPSS
jgi:hypothetical protein